MNKKKLALCIALLGTIWGFSCFGQKVTYLFGRLISNIETIDIQDVIRLTNSIPVINMHLPTQKVGPSAKTYLNDATGRIRISSIIEHNATLGLSASIHAGDLSKGTVLKLVVRAPNKNFKGNPGNIGSEIILSNSTKNIITEIGSCYSGKAEDDGYGLEYTCELSPEARSYASFPRKPVTVTLTVTAGV
jgi:hypothetical protein